MAVEQVDYAGLAPRVLAALREHFPQDTIALSEGYMGRVHVKVVSEKFNGLSEPEKQDMIWVILEGELGEDAKYVTLAIAYGTDEL